MKTVVISLGGSLIIPERMDIKFLETFKRTLQKYYATHRFVVVCGGGTIARKYMTALKEEEKTEKEISLAGIRATRMNALFMIQFFGKDTNKALPKDMVEVEHSLKKNKVVLCGALRFTNNSTSDTTAAKLAEHLKTEFINITNVEGLYSADPKLKKDSVLISSIGWREFEKKANARKHFPGQHFVLDQESARIIRQYKIPVYIIGKKLKNLEKILSNKPFIGTIIAEKKPWKKQ